jgi:hypothetical protein
LYLANCIISGLWKGIKSVKLGKQLEIERKHMRPQIEDAILIELGLGDCCTVSEAAVRIRKLPALENELHTQARKMAKEIMASESRTQAFKLAEEERLAKEERERNRNADIRGF